MRCREKNWKSCSALRSGESWSAYQTDTLISIYEILVEMSRQIGKEVLERTILFPDLLAFLYDGWMRQEDSHMQELQTAVLGELEEMKETAGKNEQEVQAA